MAEKIPELAQQRGAPPRGLALTLDPAGDHTYGGLDRFGRVVDQRWQTDAPVLRDQFRYGYDRASSRLWRDVGPDMATPPTGKDELYAYDGLHRLTDARRGTLAGNKQSIASDASGREAYALDALGNWHGFQKDATDGQTWDLDQARQHNKANEIADTDDPPDGQSITASQGLNWLDPLHDKAGNMTRAPRPNAEATAAEGLLCVYDAWNRLVAVWKDDGDGTLETTGTPPDDTLLAKYQYDGLRRRIAKLVPNETNWNRTDYYYNASWQCLEERTETVAGEATAAEDVKVQYVWDIRYIDAPVLRWRDTGGDPDLDDTLYFCQDANMNVTALVDGTTGSGTFGTVVERVQYDPYGKPTFCNGSWTLTQLGQEPAGTLSAYANEILFCGYRFDSETLTYHVRHRMYHPTLGRWLQRDPVEYADGSSFYQYGHSGPMSGLDPTGLTVRNPALTIGEWIGGGTADIVIGGGYALGGFAWIAREFFGSTALDDYDFGTAADMMNRWIDGSGGTWTLSERDLDRLRSTEWHRDAESVLVRWAADWLYTRAAELECEETWTDTALFNKDVDWREKGRLGPVTSWAGTYTVIATYQGSVTKTCPYWPNVDDDCCFYSAQLKGSYSVHDEYRWTKPEADTWLGKAKNMPQWALMEELGEAKMFHWRTHWQDEWDISGPYTNLEAVRGLAPHLGE